MRSRSPTAAHTANSAQQPTRTAVWYRPYASMPPGSAGMDSAQASVTTGSAHSARAVRRTRGRASRVHAEPAARAATDTAETSTHVQAASSTAYHQAPAAPRCQTRPCAPATAKAAHSTPKSRASASPSRLRRTANANSAAASGPSTSTQADSAFANETFAICCAVPSTGG
ncbi:MAG: hypothetical protein ACLR3C_18235 [Eggerthella lenta]